MPAGISSDKEAAVTEPLGRDLDNFVAADAGCEEPGLLNALGNRSEGGWRCRRQVAATVQPVAPKSW